MCLQWPSQADKLHSHSPLVSRRFSSASLSKKKNVFYPFYAPLLSPCCCLHVSLGPALQIFRLSMWDIEGPSVWKDWGLIEQLQHICFPSCTVIRGFIRGMLYTKPTPCILTRLLPYKCLHMGKSPSSPQEKIMPFIYIHFLHNIVSSGRVLTSGAAPYTSAFKPLNQVDDNSGRRQHSANYR